MSILCIILLHQLWTIKLLVLQNTSWSARSSALIIFHYENISIISWYLDLVLLYRLPLFKSFWQGFVDINCGFKYFWYLLCCHHNKKNIKDTLCLQKTVNNFAYVGLWARLSINRSMQPGVTLGVSDLSHDQVALFGGLEIILLNLIIFFNNVFKEK